MERFMRSMSNGGVAYSRDNATPLSNEELQSAVPSLFATEAHESRSDRFVPIPTSGMINGLRSEGFQPFFAQQANSRTPGKAAFTKHVVRMRHETLSSDSGEAFEIILINANDGTSSYNMLPGFFRFVCMNGLFTGDVFDKVRISHSRKNAIHDVIEGAYTVLENAPKVVDAVQRFKGITLQGEEMKAFADAAHLIRFPDAYSVESGKKPFFHNDRAAIGPRQLLQPRRSADRRDDLWSVFNVIQENAVRGGQRGVIRGKNGDLRNAKVRAVNGIDQKSKLNQALWMLADSMADLKTTPAQGTLPYIDAIPVNV